MKTIERTIKYYKCDYCDHESKFTDLIKSHINNCIHNPEYDESKRIYQMTTNFTLMGGELSTDELKDELYSCLSGFVIENKYGKQVQIEIEDWNKDCIVKKAIDLEKIEKQIDKELK